MIRASSNGGTIVKPRSRWSTSAAAIRCNDVVPANWTSAPYARVPSTFTAGAVVGMTTMAGIENRAAAQATAWPWLPDEYVTTPRARTAGSI